MEAKYKIGDVVTIKERVGEANDYKFGFVKEMAEVSGQKFTITGRVRSSAYDCKIPDDGFEYFLDGIRYSWASSMFEDITECMDSCVDLSATECSKDGGIDAFIRRKECPTLDFSL